MTCDCGWRGTVQPATLYAIEEYGDHRATTAGKDGTMSPDEIQAIYTKTAITVGQLRGLEAMGYVVIKDEPDHYVTFDEDGWFIEHSVACRVAGTLGTCDYNKAIRMVADEPDPDDFGRWRITELDSEGLPSLERAGGSN
jgi:hypothetical protein